MSDISDDMLKPDEPSGQPEQQPAYPSVPAPHTLPSTPPFAAEVKDGVFALFAFILGYFFCRWVLTSFFGWGAAVFTAMYLSSVLFYLLKKGVRPTRESWFWFAVTALTGLSSALWNDMGLIPLRNMFLFCSAVYWMMTAASVQISGKTGNYLLLDGINAVCVIPFRNFINQYRALGALRGGRQKDRKKILSVLLGIALAIIILLIVTPQLLKADSGGFKNLVYNIFYFLRFDWVKILEFLLYCFLAVPTAAYLFGLASGSAVKRGTDAFTEEKAEKAVAAVKITPPVTIYIILGAVCVMYIIFIGCQLPYFFSAFTGTRPDGWLSYSEYARQGFFELCGVAAINLALLTAANILSKKPRENHAVLKAFNIILALITLLLIATAFSKMTLYIGAFGLTILRILPCVFMVLLAFICVALIVLQKVKFSIVRASLIFGAVLFTALCLADTDSLVVRYNTDRYLSGALDQYDTDILYRSGPAGVLPALDVFNTTSDTVLKEKIGAYLADQKESVGRFKGAYRETLQMSEAWEMIKDLN
ncbi:MAG: DUF4173 domain-containing protein [Clostridiales bacterium]|nr:DUF4173 domain-containing protein [Clostridiales bacterium]